MDGLFHGTSINKWITGGTPMTIQIPRPELELNQLAKTEERMMADDGNFGMLTNTGMK